MPFALLIPSRITGTGAKSLANGAFVRDIEKSHVH